VTHHPNGVNLDQVTDQMVNRVNIRVSGVCRLLPPTHCVSVSPMEIADARIQLARGREVPTRDTDDLKASDGLRRSPDLHGFTNGLPVFANCGRSLDFDLLRDRFELATISTHRYSKIGVVNRVGISTLN
jgi:hypothetical protein